MSVNVTMPKLGMTMKVGKVSKWYKNEGDAVAKGEVIFEVETEKITNKIESPDAGILFQIVVPEGTTVPVGTIVAVIAQPGEKPERIAGVQAGEAVEARPSPDKSPSADFPGASADERRILSTPSARRVRDARRLLGRREPTGWPRQLACLGSAAARCLSQQMARVWQQPSGQGIPGGSGFRHAEHDLRLLGSNREERALRGRNVGQIP